MEDDFKEIIPKTNRQTYSNLESKIRFQFTTLQNGSPALNVFIGKDWLLKLDLKEGDTLSFAIKEANFRIWRIKLAANKEGWKLKKNYNVKSPSYLYITIPWTREIPPEFADKQIIDMKFIDIYGGGFRLGLPGLEEGDFLIKS